MRLYHGSTVGGIKILKPKQADHDRPYVYMTTMDVVAAFYLCNAVEKPYYWFPYGFTEEGLPIYHELYPNALREVSDGVSGYIYEVNADESQVIPFKNIPCARLATKDIKVAKSRKIDSAYNLFKEYVRQGKMVVGKYEEKSETELNNWYAMIYDYISEKNMIMTSDCSYARFVKNKFPWVWEKYEKNNILGF